MSRHPELAKAALYGQPERMMARLSPKHLLVMLLAVVVTAGFSLSAAQAAVMSARMAVDGRMTMAADTGTTDADMAKMADARDGDCNACLKGSAGNDKPMQCAPTCVAPVLAVLPEAFPVTGLPRVELPSALTAPFLHGRSLLPEPFPPRPSALV
ncbi:hypothetical protein [Mesorhizobium sp. M0019]|uniref:hypothetical protein n=2 Tax=unclassified Mesorhizobium TaxID=325217 RepID=UPI0033392DC3